MKKLLLACGIAAALVAGIVIQSQFAPVASYAQPAPQPP
jgi:hypothetical protein